MFKTKTSTLQPLKQYTYTQKERKKSRNNYNHNTAYMRVVKDIFVTRDRPFLLPVKCETAMFFLVNRDFKVAVKRDFVKLFSVKRKNRCFIGRES